jgi:hypothetical protein
VSYTNPPGNCKTPLQLLSVAGPSVDMRLYERQRSLLNTQGHFFQLERA